MMTAPSTHSRVDVRIERKAVRCRLFGGVRRSTSHDGGPFVPMQSFDNFPKRFQDLKFALVVSFCLIEQHKRSV